MDIKDNEHMNHTNSKNLGIVFRFDRVMTPEGTRGVQSLKTSHLFTAKKFKLISYIIQIIDLRQSNHRS